MSNQTSPTVHLPAPEVGPVEVRGIRLTDVGSILHKWEVSMNLSSGKRLGSYQAMVILSVEEGSNPERLSVTVSPINPETNTYRFREGARRSTRSILRDGQPISTCDIFDQPLQMVASAI